MLRNLIAAILATVVLAPISRGEVETTHGAQIKDITTIEGVRDNPLVGYGVVVGGTAGSGVILLSLLMAAGVEGAGVIATDAAISIVVGIVKISVFGLFGVITAQVLAFALLTGLVALPGAFLAKTFVERMPMHVHTAILDAVVLLGGVFLVWGALH